MRIKGVNIHVHNIHADSTADGLPPTYEVFTGGGDGHTYIGHCFQEARGRWRWASSSPQGGGITKTRGQCLTAIIEASQSARAASM